MNTIDFTQQIVEFFNTVEELSNISNFNGSQFAQYCRDYYALTIEETIALVCNLEDIEAMQEIIDGDYSNFDPWNESLFNDGYYDMMYDLGLMAEDDYEDDDHDFTDEDADNGPYGRII